MKVRFYELEEIDSELLKYAVINSVYDDKLVLVRHKERKTWEIPGGRREEGEYIDKTAERELQEETGATKYKLAPICDYSVERGSSISYGRLFNCEIYDFGELGESEIVEVRLFEDLPNDLTYPDIQPFLKEEVEKRKCKI